MLHWNLILEVNKWDLVEGVEVSFVVCDELPLFSLNFGGWFCSLWTSIVHK